MNHSDIQSRMAGYLDGELALGERALFDAHLDQCEPCSRELAEMRSTIGLLRRLPTPEPPPDLVDQVMRRIAEGEGRPTWLGRMSDAVSQILAPRFMIPATALAAGLALTFIPGDLPLRLQDLGRASRNPEVAALIPASSSGAVRDGAGRTLNRSQTAGGTRLEVRIESNARGSSPVAGADSSGLLAVGGRLAPRHSSLHGPVQDGSGSFLYRVANEPLGPLRRQTRNGASDFVMRAEDPLSGRSQAPTDPRAGLGLFAVAPTREGPYLGASAVSSQDLGISVYQWRWSDGSSPLSMSRVSAQKTASGLVARRQAEATSGDVELSKTERRRRKLDERLRFLLQDPPGFARGFAAVGLAERELWLRELAVRADEVGEVDRGRRVLSTSGDPTARELAEDFSRSLRQGKASWAEVDIESAP